jgi:hypothetical protein
MGARAQSVAVLTVALAASSLSAPLAAVRATHPARPITSPDAADVVQKVRHHIEGRGGAFRVGDRAYRAFFSRSGIRVEPPGDHGGLTLGAARLSGAPRGPAGPWTASDNVVRRLLRPGITERVTARDGSLEWDLVLNGRPAPGPLRIDVPLSGVAAPDVVAAGRPGGRAVRFPTRGGAAVRVGEAVFVDAGGAVLGRLLPAASARRLSLTVPAAVLARARYPLTIDPTISTEADLTVPISGAAEGSQSFSRIAFDGSNYLVVWMDARTGQGLAGARVTPSGTVLDTVGFRITTRRAFDPDVEWNGSNYLVVWQDGSSGYNIYGTRVSAAGAVLDGNGFSISSASGNQRSPKLAVAGSTFLVAWEDDHLGASSDPFDIFGARVSSAGIVLDPSGIAISTATLGQYGAAVASDGTDFLVTWGDNRTGTTQVEAARVTGAGTVLDPSGILVSTTGGGNADVAWGTDRYLLVWQTGSFLPDADIAGARVDATGTVLDATPIAISTAAEGQVVPSVWWGGTVFLAAWDDMRRGVDFDSDIYGTRVDLSGSVLDPSGIAIEAGPGTRFAPGIAWGGSNFLVEWNDSTETNDIVAKRVSDTGAVLDAPARLISSSSDWQMAPATAWNGSVFLVVWEEYRGIDASDIYGARVDANGVVLDPAGLVISAATSSQRSPAVASNGSDFLVVWKDVRGGSYYDIYGARVTGAGALLDPGGLAISTASFDQQDPAVAWNGTNYLVAWADQRTDYPDGDIYGGRVSATAPSVTAVLDGSGFAISAATEAQSHPSVAAGGSTWLVAWHDWRTGVFGNLTDIYAARVGASGAVVDASGIAVSTASGEQWEPSVAWDGTNFLAAWEDERSFGNPNVYGSRISATGSVLEPSGIAISTASNTQDHVTAIYDGGRFLVAWHDTRTENNVYGARVKSDASVMDPSGFAIASSSDAEDQPALAAGAAGRVGAAYRRNATAAPYGAHRTRFRFVDDDFIAPETTITSSPPSFTSSTSATFAFSASEPATFACSLDGAAFSACSSPKTYTGLSETSHTFQVRATDLEGNADPTSASRTWTVDFTVPDTTITSGPSGTVLSATATFAFNATEASTFGCSLDGGTFASCNSPKTYTGLSEADHTFAVRAIDLAGNTDPSPATASWTVRIPPDTAITSSPAAYTSSTSATFAFTSTKPGSTFACKLDAGATVACSSPVSYSGLSAASHTFTVTATDSNGTADPTPAAKTWMIDVTAPGYVATTRPWKGLYVHNIQVTDQTPGITVVGFVDLEAHALDAESPISAVKFTVDGNTYNATYDAGRAAWYVKYQVPSAGTRTITVTATNAAGLTATGAPVTMTAYPG